MNQDQGLFSLRSDFGPFHKRRSLVGMKACPQPLSEFFTKGLYHRFPGFGFGSKRYGWFKCHGVILNLHFSSKNQDPCHIFNVMHYAIYLMISRQSTIAGQRYGFYVFMRFMVLKIKAVTRSSRSMP